MHGKAGRRIRETTRMEGKCGGKTVFHCMETCFERGEHRLKLVLSTTNGLSLWCHPLTTTKGPSVVLASPMLRLVKYVGHPWPSPKVWREALFTLGLLLPNTSGEAPLTSVYTTREELQLR